MAPFVHSESEFPLKVLEPVVSQGQGRVVVGCGSTVVVVVVVEVTVVVVVVVPKLLAVVVTAVSMLDKSLSGMRVVVRVLSTLPR